jgi:2-octaprenyl-6-methoxyphenol hydroxylase
VIAAYAGARPADMVSREIGIDLLNRALLSNLLPVQAARGLGMHALANSATLRRAAMQLGLNGPGTPPPLMRAQALA